MTRSRDHHAATGDAEIGGTRAPAASFLLGLILLLHSPMLTCAFTTSYLSTSVVVEVVPTAARHHRDVRRHRGIPPPAMGLGTTDDEDDSIVRRGMTSMWTSSSSSLSSTTSSTRRDVLVGTLLTTTTAILLPSPSHATDEDGGRGIVVVAGATGQTGRRILERLALSSATPVIAGVRDIDRAKKALSESSTVIRGAMVQRVNSVSSAVGGGDVTLKHLDVASDTIDEMTNTLMGANSLIIAVGFVPGNPLKMNAAAHEVDNVGTCKLIDAAKAAGVKKVVMISSILSNGRAWGQEKSPGFVVTNAFGNVLDEKIVAERHLRDSGLDYTIVRPGGLKSKPPTGALRISPEDTLNAGEISRDLVADVCVACLTDVKARNRVLEIIEDAESEPRAFNGLIM